MNAKVNPLVALLVIALALGIFAVKFHADGAKAHLPGPSLLRTTADGELFLVLGQSLYHFDANGQWRETLKLDDFGITDLVGDIAFFSNGDLLARAEPANPDGEAGIHAGDLVRCTLADHHCQRFGNEDFHKVFRLAIDADDTVWVADTMRHRLLRFAPDGALQGEMADSGRYPNQLLHEDDTLYVTNSDGRDHAMEWFAISGQGIGEKQGSANLSADARVAAGHVMASDLLRVGDTWWVNLMKVGQKDGGIYRFTKDWTLIDRLPLPANADPLLMAHYQGDVLVSDYSLRRIYRFGADGQPRADFEPEVLQQALLPLRERFVQMTWLSRGALGAFGLLLVAGFAAGIRQMNQAPMPAVSAPSLAESSVSPSDTSIHWIEVNPAMRRQMRLVLLLMPVILVVQVGLLASKASRSPAMLHQMLPLLGFMVLVLVPVLWLSGRAFKQRIGVCRGMLVLQDGRGRIAVGQGERILYSDNAIVIDEVVVNLGNGTRSLFPLPELVEHVYPLLKSGRPVPAMTLQWMLLRRRDPARWLSWGLAAAGLVLLLAITQGWITF